MHGHFVALVLLAIATSNLAHAADDDWGNNRFYFENKRGVGSLPSSAFPSKRFYVDEPFRLVHTYPTTNVASIVWDYPDSCTLNSAQQYNTIPSDTVEGTCSTAGVHKFQVRRDNDLATTDTFYITFNNRDGCYSWYFVTGTISDESAEFNTTSLNRVYPSKNLSAYIWITDPKYLGAREANGTAITPSGVSKQVTDALQSLGEMPDVSFSDVSSHMKINSLEYSQTKKLWVLNYTASLPLSVAVTVRSHGISVMNCKVQDGPSYQITVSRPTTELFALEPYTGPFASLSSLDTNAFFFDVFADSCSHETVLTMSSLYPLNTIAYSHNVFSGAKELFRINGVASRIIDMALTPRGLLVLTNSSELFFTGGEAELSSPSGISTSDLIDNIQSVSQCDVVNYGSSLDTKLNLYVVAWSQSQGGASYFLSKDGGQTFVTKSLNGAGVNVSMIEDVAIVHASESITFLIRDTSSVHSLLLMDVNSERVTQGHKFASLDDYKGVLISDANTLSKPRLLNAESGSSELFFWGDNVFYSPNGGKSAFALQLISRNPLKPQASLATGEYVLEVVTSGEGGVAILTSDNRVFYTRAGLPTALELSAGIAPNALARLKFDADNNLYVLSPSIAANGSYLKSRVLTVEADLLSPRSPSAFNPALECPYQSFSANLLPEYYLDMQDTFTFSLNITPKSAQIPQTLSVIFSNPEILSIDFNETTKTNSYDAGAYSATYKVTTDTSPSSGTSDVRVRPHNVNLACSQTQVVARVRATCPPGRSIRLRVPQYASQLTCADGPETVNYPANSYYDASTAGRGLGKTITYNCSKYGPPIPQFYGSAWRPELDLYDGDTFLRRVTANFALYELNGRDQFEYNMTAEMAGCCRTPQSWSEFIRTNPEDPFLAWSPSNYQSCFAPSSGTPANLTQKYQLFNASNYLALYWNGGRDGVYLFSAVVLDPEYSFCTLRTHFAVSVYGAPLDSGVQAGIVVALISGVMLVLVGSYFWYRESRKKKDSSKEKLS